MKQPLENIIYQDKSILLDHFTIFAFKIGPPHVIQAGFKFTIM